MKHLYTKILAALAVVSTAAFFIFRFFFVKDPKTSEDFPQSEKNRLLKEKKLLEKESSSVDEKVYTDKDITDKFN